MDKQTNKRKFHNLLFLKTGFWFAVIMLLFAVVLGVIYMRMYEQTIMENYREETKEKAESVAKRCSDFFFANDPDGWQDYVIMLSEIEQVEIWTVSNDDVLFPLSDQFAFRRDVFLNSDSYQNNYEDILNNVFHNIPTSRSGFSEIHEMNIITIGMPVSGSKR